MVSWNFYEKGHTSGMAVRIFIIGIIITGGAGAIPAGSVHNVNKDVDYISIQAAIDDARPGDEIYVDSGIYYENVNVNRQLILKANDTGAGIPLINAGGNGSAVVLGAGNSTLDGFDVTNSVGEWPASGILVLSSNNIIKNNDAEYNDRGIVVFAGTNNTLDNNTASRNNQTGILIENSGNNSMRFNIAGLNNVNGIALVDSLDNSLDDNSAVSNNKSGIVLLNSTYNRINRNMIMSNNNTGAVLNSSNHNIFSGNIISLNAGDGIWLGKADENVIYGNNVSDNTVNNGISLQSSNNNTIMNNIVYSNRRNGINFYNSSSYNTILNNNFINNSRNAHDESAGNSWYHNGSGNYWSDYNGSDANGRSIGGIPYNISGGAGAKDNFPYIRQNGWMISIVDEVISRYDADRNGKISRNEAIRAVDDYFLGDITRQYAVEIVRVYFSG